METKEKSKWPDGIPWIIVISFLLAGALLLRTGVIPFSSAFGFGRENGGAAPLTGWRQTLSGWDKPPQKKDTGETETQSQILSIDESDWRLILVNRDNPMPEDYSVTLAPLSNGFEFDSRAIESLEEMLSDGQRAGLNLTVCSAYRTVAYQEQLFLRQVEKQMKTGLEYIDAAAKAMTVVAYPGQSEHNLGLAADIVSGGYQRLDDGYAETAEAKWLLEHCADYGFILRYPQDKQEITGIIFEPWHFRYVGREAARYIMENGLCLEEYLSLSKQV